MPSAGHAFNPPRRPVDIQWADRVKALRAKLGVTQVDMAKMLGVATVTVRKWEAHDRTPTRRFSQGRSYLRNRIEELERTAASIDPNKPKPDFSLKADRRKPIVIE